jgi:hypothetical protein
MDWKSNYSVEKGRSSLRRQSCHIFASAEQQFRAVAFLVPLQAALSALGRVRMPYSVETTITVEAAVRLDGKQSTGDMFDHTPLL